MHLWGSKVASQMKGVRKSLAFLKRRLVAAKRVRLETEARKRLRSTVAEEEPSGGHSRALLEKGHEPSPFSLPLSKTRLSLPSISIDEALSRQSETTRAVLGPSFVSGGGESDALETGESLVTIHFDSVPSAFKATGRPSFAATAGPPLPAESLRSTAGGSTSLVAVEAPERHKVSAEVRAWKSVFSHPTFASFVGDYCPLSPAGAPSEKRVLLFHDLAGWRSLEEILSLCGPPSSLAHGDVLLRVWAGQLLGALRCLEERGLTARLRPGDVAVSPDGRQVKVVSLRGLLPFGAALSPSVVAAALLEDMTARHLWPPEVFVRRLDAGEEEGEEEKRALQPQRSHVVVPPSSWSLAGSPAAGDNAESGTVSASFSPFLFASLLLELYRGSPPKLPQCDRVAAVAEEHYSPFLQEQREITSFGEGEIASFALRRLLRSFPFPARLEALHPFVFEEVDDVPGGGSPPFGYELGLREVAMLCLHTLPEERPKLAHLSSLPVFASDLSDSLQVERQFRAWLKENLKVERAYRSLVEKDLSRICRSYGYQLVQSTADGRKELTQDGSVEPFLLESSPAAVRDEDAVASEMVEALEEVTALNISIKWPKGKGTDEGNDSEEEERGPKTGDSGDPEAIAFDRVTGTVQLSIDQVREAFFALFCRRLYRLIGSFLESDSSKDTEGALLDSSLEGERGAWQWAKTARKVTEEDANAGSTQRLRPAAPSLPTDVLRAVVLRLDQQRVLPLLVSDCCRHSVFVTARSDCPSAQAVLALENEVQNAGRLSSSDPFSFALERVARLKHHRHIGERKGAKESVRIKESGRGRLSALLRPPLAALRQMFEETSQSIERADLTSVPNALVEALLDGVTQAVMGDLIVPLSSE